MFSCDLILLLSVKKEIFQITEAKFLLMGDPFLLLLVKYINAILLFSKKIKISQRDCADPNKKNEIILHTYILDSY